MSTPPPGLRERLADVTLDAVYALSPERHVLAWNWGAETLYGVAAADACGRPLDALTLPAERRDETHARIEEAVATGSAIYESVRRAADGTDVLVQVVMRPVKAPDGTLQAILVSESDRTDAKRLEGQLFEQFWSLRESESRHRALAAQLQSQSGLLELLERVAVAANQATSVHDALQTALDAVCAHTGWPVGHVYLAAPDGSGLAPTRLWHLDEPGRFDTFRRLTEATRFDPGVGLPGRVLASGAPAWVTDVTKDDNFPRARVAIDIGVRGAFGFPVRTGAAIVAVLEFFTDRPAPPDPALLAVMDHVGTQLGRVFERKRAEEALLSNHLDLEDQVRQRTAELAAANERLRTEVLERRRAEGALQKAYERLKELDQLKTRFINMAAHELRTPLTPIKLQVHSLRRAGSGLARSRGGPDEQTLHSLDMLDRNVDRLTHLIEDVLDGARLQAGKLRVVPQELDLAEVAAQAVASAEPQAASVGVALGLDADARVTARADPDRLAQVLVNLVENALKFTPRGGHVTVSVARDGADAVVAVTDTGQGMEPEQIARLFQPFSQVHDTMQKTGPGSGLGLYICKGIVEQHGGVIWCESPGSGRGTTFAFRLPACGPHGAAP